MNQNSPNPFNAGTVIKYELRRAGTLSLRIFDMLGREISVLEQGERSRGNHTAFWNGRNSSGMPVSSGVYFYRLEAGRQAETRRMTLVR
ncbi:T9SS type A sorting domain-containing protein [Candidatus Omnitrophota bacterium]